MMLSVSVHYLNKKAQPDTYGEIHWDGKTITTTNNSIALVAVAKSPFRLPDGRAVYPDKDPELFMRSLYIFYSGSYFWCDKAIEL